MLYQGSLFAEPSSEDDAAPVKEVAEKKAVAAPAKSALKRRKKAQRAVQDYYTLLEISEDAQPNTIKSSYIEKVKQYPPESHPAEFQQIRLAYDTLRNPQLRKEYDILQKYGESIEDLLQEATGGAISISKQAVKLLERAVTIDPQHNKARFALAYAYLGLGNELAFATQFAALKKLVSADEWPAMWSNKIKILLQALREDEAFAELQKFKAANPLAIRKFWDLYLDVYSAVDREPQLLNELEAQIRAIDPPQPTAIALYAAWINITDSLEERGKCLKAQTATRRFIKNFRNPGDLAVIAAILIEEYRQCREDGDFSGAKMFVDLALAVDKNNQELQQASVQMQTIAAMLREVDRAIEDEQLFPLVLLDVIGWIAEEFQIMDDVLEDMTNELPKDLLEEMRGFPEDYAAGIIRLKKKCPSLYRYYQQRWDKLFQEKTVGLNRETRRSLRL